MSCAERTRCQSLVPPTGTPLTGYPTSPLDYYYVQGVHKWQAPCNNSTALDLSVTAGWGDNLSGDAKLKVGSPIRVELGLFNDDVRSGRGLHRDQAGSGRARSRVPLRNPCDVRRSERVHGHPDGLHDAAGVRHRGLAHRSRTPPPAAVVVDEDATAEINATGNVVYGYNLRVPDRGPVPDHVHRADGPRDERRCGNRRRGHAQRRASSITVGSGGGGGRRKAHPSVS